MIDLSRLHIIEKKKVGALVQDDCLIKVKTQKVKSKAGTLLCQLKIHLNTDFMDELKIPHNSSFKFAFDPDDIYKWYLILDKDGYSACKQNNVSKFYVIGLSSPFKLIDMYLTGINKDKITIYPEQNVIEFDVKDAITPHALELI